MAKPAATSHSSVGSPRHITCSSASEDLVALHVHRHLRQRSGSRTAQHLAGRCVELAAVTGAADLAAVRRADAAALMRAGGRQAVHGAGRVLGEYDAIRGDAVTGDL